MPRKDLHVIILDLFCCEGGAARGYQLAGFEVFGVDLLPKYSKRYAGDHFLSMSALEALEVLIAGGSLDFGGRLITLDDITAIHASPPCQKYSVTNAARQHDYPDLVGPTRELLKQTGRPYIIENVVGAPLLNPTTLCWSMFYESGSVLDDDGTPLRMERHRLFETDFPLTTPRADDHPKDVQVAGSYGGARRDKWEAKHIRKGGYVPAKHIQERLLGIDWMTQYGLYQSLPPAYTQWVGQQIPRPLEGLF